MKLATTRVVPTGELSRNNCFFLSPSICRLRNFHDNYYRVKKVFSRWKGKQILMSITDTLRLPTILPTARRWRRRRRTPCETRYLLSVNSYFLFKILLKTFPLKIFMHAVRVWISRIFYRKAACGVIVNHLIIVLTLVSRASSFKKVYASEQIRDISAVNDYSHHQFNFGGP